MPIPATDKGGSDFEPIPAGSHHGVCYGVVDIGTQPPMPNSRYAPSRKVVLLFELPHERGDFPDANDKAKKVSKPRALSTKYTLSLSPKANLRKDLEAWRAKQFQPSELEGFDIAKLIGANTFLSVVHQAGTGKNTGKTYANIATINPLPKGTAKLEPENQPLYFSFFDLKEGEKISFPQNMPEWIQKLIMESDEYINRSQHEEPPPAGDKPANQENLDEDVPF